MSTESSSGHARSPSPSRQQTTSIEATLALFAQRPERIAITQNDRSLTYGELLNHIYRTARALQAQGIRRRDVVALATGNRPETFVLRYAANLLGCCTTVLYDDLAAPLIAEILH